MSQFNYIMVGIVPLGFTMLAAGYLAAYENYAEKRALEEKMGMGPAHGYVLPVKVWEDPNNPVICYPTFDSCVLVPYEMRGPKETP